MLYTLLGVVDKQSSRASMAEQCRCHGIFSKVLYLEWWGEGWLDRSVNLFCTWIMSCFLKVSIVFLARKSLTPLLDRALQFAALGAFSTVSHSTSYLMLALPPPNW